MAHGHQHAAARTPPVQDGSFMGELRQHAMRLHTRQQAPREGKAEPVKRDHPWAPTLSGYLQFLADSKVVFDTFEELLAAGGQPYYEQFAGTPLQRGAAIQHDLEYLSREYGLPLADPAEDGPGKSYARVLRELAASSPPAFLCHFYNHYFAHTAGGRIIGKQVSNKLLQGWTGNFYMWDVDVKDLLEDVRARLESVAQGWTDAERTACLDETAATFFWGGKLLHLIAGEYL